MKRMIVNTFMVLTMVCSLLQGAYAQEVMDIEQPQNQNIIQNDVPQNQDNQNIYSNMIFYNLSLKNWADNQIFNYIVDGWLELTMGPRHNIIFDFVPTDPNYNDFWTWGLFELNLEKAWDLATGAGVIAAVVDTGVYRLHSDIEENIWINEAEANGVLGFDDDANGYVDDIYGYDFGDFDNDPTDTQGHGTFISGIIAAEENNDTGIVGVAFDSKIMGLKVEDSAGDISSIYLPGALEYAADMGARVINISFGGTNNIYKRMAFEYARDAGCILVTSSGNDHGEIDNYPALYDYFITVGSIDSSGNRSDFSEYGDALDFVAPGELIYSLTTSNGYRFGSGTSFACPYVVGVIALLLEQVPTLTRDDVYRRLKFSAKDKGALGWDQYYGWGIIDAFEALSYDWYDTGKVKKYWLAEADAFGGIYYEYYISSNWSKVILDSGAIYEYLDEDYNGQGYGRITKEVRVDGSYNTRLYYQSTENIETIFEYNSQSEILEIRNYYENNSGVLKSKILSVADGNGAVLYEYYLSGFRKKMALENAFIYNYLDEDWQGQGYGRISKEMRTDGTYNLRTYYASTGNLETVIEYDSINTLLQTKVYYENESGVIFSRELTTPDLNGTIYFEYYLSGLRKKLVLETGYIYELMDENWQDRGYGRVFKETRPDGSYNVCTYYASTGNLETVTEYDFENTLLQTKVYYENESGVIFSRELIIPDENSAVYYEYYLSGLPEKMITDIGNIYNYMDEDWDAQGYGRITKEMRPDGTYNLCTYYASTGNLETIIEYDSTNKLLETRVYYENAPGVLFSIARPPSISNFIVYYEYYLSGLKRIVRYRTHRELEYTDEDYQGQGFGQVLKLTRFDGSYSTFEYDEITRYLLTEIEYTVDTQVVQRIEYYNDVNRNMKNKTLTLADVNGALYYTYYNDEFNSVEYMQLATSDAQGNVLYKHTYFEGTNSVHLKYAYPSSLDLPYQEYKIYEYSSSTEKLIKITFIEGVDLPSYPGTISHIEYYDDVSGDFYKEEFFNAGVWFQTIEYWADAVSIKKILRANTPVEGEVLYEEYNEQGSIIQKDTDDKVREISVYRTDGITLSIFYIYYFNDIFWSLKEERVYWFDGITIRRIHYANTAVEGEVITEFFTETTGRLEKREYDNNDIEWFYYWHLTGNLESIDYYNDSTGNWVWYKTEDYWQDGITLKAIFRVDTLAENEVLHQENNEQGNWTWKRYDNQKAQIMQYYEDGVTRMQHEYYNIEDNDDLTWRETDLYWESGNLKQIFRVNTPLEGEIVYEEYDRSGDLSFVQYDNGNVIIYGWFSPGDMLVSELTPPEVVNALYSEYDQMINLKQQQSAGYLLDQGITFTGSMGTTENQLLNAI